MLPALLLSPLLFCIVSPSPLESRQLISVNTILSAVAGLVPSIQGSTRLAKPQIRQDATRKVIRYGPFTLPPNKDIGNSSNSGQSMEGMNDHDMDSMGGDMGGNMGGGSSNPLDLLAMATGAKPMDPSGIGMLKKLSTTFCKDCTVLAGEITVKFEDGSRADVSNGVYLHHVTVLDVSKAAQSVVADCGGAASAITAFLAAGIDGSKRMFTTEDGKFPSGFYIKDDTFVMQAEFVNYRNEEQKVYVDMDFEYLSGKVGTEAFPVKLSATDCASATLSFKPKPGQAGEIKSKLYPVKQDGTILIPHGHMHDGGTAVNMFVNDRLVCKSEAVYVPGDLSTISSMSECNKTIPVKKGDNILITAGYDLKAHPARESHGEGQEMMGMMFFVFAAAGT